MFVYSRFGLCEWLTAEPTTLTASIRVADLLDPVACALEANPADADDER